MPPIACCPARQDLLRFSLGQLGTTEAEQIERHLTACGQCLAELEMLSSADALTEAVRAQAATPAPVEDDTVNRLIEELQNRPPHAAEQTTAGSVAAPPEEATQMPAGAGTPPAAPPEGVTQATRAGAPSAGVPNGYDFLAPPQAADEIGRLGPYRVLEVLGAGGMGVVFRAESLQLGRPVALKVMLPAMAATASARERFLREARTAAAIEHDHVITIYQVGEDRGVPFIAMQLLKGESLDDRLRRDSTLPIAEVLRIGREIAAGLAAAHERGLIHRDIKPANLWLEGERGRVKILDFGLARAARDNTHLTQSGLIIGTPAYMAPEQSRATGVDHRADLFSLGCVLYRLCTGRMPFNGTDTISLLASLALDEPPPPRQLNDRVPPRLSRLIMLLLAKEPVGRPPSARAVVEAITALEAGGPMTAMQGIREGRTEVLGALPADPAQRVRRAPARPRRRWSWAVAAVVLLAILGPLGYWGAVTIVRLASGNGQLVIETDDPDVEVRVKQNGEQVTIVDAKTNKEITLRAGTYQLELAGGKDGLALSTNHFTLHRGGREVVTVRLEADTAATGRPRLLAPAEGAVLSNARPDNGANWGFQWTAVRGATAYHLLVSGPAARIPQVNEDHLRGTAYRHVLKGYVIEPNRRGWRWKVRARINESWSDWSEERTFEVGPREGQSLAPDEVRRFVAGRGGKENPGQWDDALGVAVTPDGRLFIGCQDGVLRQWDLATGEERKQWRLGERVKHVTHVGLMPDHQHVLCGLIREGWMGFVLFDPQTGQEVRRFHGRETWPTDAIVSPDGRQFIGTGNGSVLAVYDVATGARRRTITTPLWVTRMTASADFRWALSCSQWKTTAWLWDIASGKPGRQLVGHTDGIVALALSPEGRRALTGGKDRTVRLWDAETGKELQRFEGHTDIVSSVALSSDGRRVLSGSADRTLRLWDVESGKELHCFRGHTGKITTVRFLADGRQALSASIDQSVRLWRLPID